MAAMIDRRAEWAIGAASDPESGVAIRLAPDGIMADFIAETVCLEGPFDAEDAAPRWFHLGWDLTGIGAEIEISPIIVGTEDAVTVDVLVTMA